MLDFLTPLICIPQITPIQNVLDYGMYGVVSMNVIKKHVKKSAKQNYTIIAKPGTYEK